jgi:hypothetical protein
MLGDGAFDAKPVPDTKGYIYIVGRSLTIPGGLDLKHNASYAARNPVANMLKREVFSADYLSQVRL